MTINLNRFDLTTLCLFVAAVHFGSLTAGATGQLLWAKTSAFGGFLPALLGRFAKAHPGVVLDLENAISEDAVRAVARGTTELAVIGDNTPAEGLHTEVCHVDELVLLLPAGHALVLLEMGRSAAMA